MLHAFLSIFTVIATGFILAKLDEIINYVLDDTITGNDLLRFELFSFLGIKFHTLFLYLSRLLHLKGNVFLPGLCHIRECRQHISSSIILATNTYSFLAFLRGSAALRPSRTLVSSVETRESSKQHLT